MMVDLPNGGNAMPIELDHTIVPSHTQVESARRLAELLGVPWAQRSVGPFSAVHVNEGLTLDFIQTDDDFPVYHFCFRVDEASFDAILGRIERWLSRLSTAVKRLTPCCVASSAIIASTACRARPLPQWRLAST